MGILTGLFISKILLLVLQAVYQCTVHCYIVIHCIGVANKHKDDLDYQTKIVYLNRLNLQEIVGELSVETGCLKPHINQREQDQEQHR